MSLRVLVAPDSFKGSLSAVEVAEAIVLGWRRIRPDDELMPIPQADGGEGTLSAVEGAVPGTRRHLVEHVTGPDGRPVDATWLELSDGTAVVELAESSGIGLMRELNPLGATSRGLGEVLAAALDAGAPRIIVGLGGSASTDGGAPVLEALAGRALPPRGVVVWSDVRAPLLGPGGAAAVFGQQKGADTAQLEVLEQRLARFARTVVADPSSPGAGAAGGVGFALLAWGARMESGARAVAELTGLRTQASTADLIVTGEGRFDASSLSGKVVGETLALGRPVALVAGSIAADPPGPAVSLERLAGNTAAAIAEAPRWVEAAGALLAEGMADDKWLRKASCC